MTIYRTPLRRILRPILTSLACAAALSSCVSPAPNSGYFAMAEGEAEASRYRANEIDREDRQIAHEERISRAQAYELSTRNNPTQLSTTTVVRPWGFWW